METIKDLGLPALILTQDAMPELVNAELGSPQLPLVQQLIMQELTVGEMIDRFTASAERGAERGKSNITDPCDGHDVLAKIDAILPEGAVAIAEYVDIKTNKLGYIVGAHGPIVKENAPYGYYAVLSFVMIFKGDALDMLKYATDNFEMLSKEELNERKANLH